MLFKRITTSILFGLVCLFPAFAAANQNTDTIAVYFEFGSSELSEKAKYNIRQLANRYEISTVDSVSFTGVADSVGSVKDNMKLSMKRAKVTRKYAKYLFRKVPQKALWRGEGSSNDQAKNRRVEIVLYYKQIHKVEVDSLPLDSPIVKLDTVSPKCYNIAYDVLAFCHSKTITLRRKQYQQLSYKHYRDPFPEDLYYGIYKDGQIILKKIKVKHRGGQKAITIRIPLDSYKRYKIFRISEKPCDECSEDFEQGKKIENVDTTRQVDYLLMDQIQYKRSFFGRRVTKIRVPREFVDLDAQYFLGCNQELPLVWEEKKGRRKKKYLYANLKIIRREYKKRRRRNNDYVHAFEYYLQNIVRVTHRCSNKSLDSHCDRPYINCYPPGPFWIDPKFTVISYGEYSRSHNNKGFVGLGLRWEGRWSFIESHVNIQTAYPSYHVKGTYRQYASNFPISFLNPAKSWYSVSDNFLEERYMRTYSSISFVKTFGNVVEPLQEISLNIGLECFTEKVHFAGANYYIEGGLAYNFDNSGPDKLYPVLKIGTAIRLFEVHY